MQLSCIIEANGTISIQETPDTAEFIRETIGGYLEMIPHIVPGHHAYVNEDGKRLGLRPNVFATVLWRHHNQGITDAICGDIIIFGSHKAPHEGPVTQVLLEALKALTDGIEEVTLP